MLAHKVRVRFYGSRVSLQGGHGAIRRVLDSFLILRELTGCLVLARRLVVFVAGFRYRFQMQTVPGRRNPALQVATILMCWFSVKWKVGALCQRV